MLCLSVRHPFAHAIFKLGKDVENRSWYCNHRGRIGIHVPRAVNHDACTLLRVPLRPSHPLGAVIGTVEIYDCVDNSESEWAARGTWHFLLRNPVLLPKPIPCAGRLRFFNVDNKSLKG